MFLFWLETEGVVLLEVELLLTAALLLVVEEELLLLVCEDEAGALDLLVEEVDDDEDLVVEDPLEVRDCALSSVCGAAMAIAMKLAVKMVANFFMVLGIKLFNLFIKMIS